MNLSFLTYLSCDIRHSPSPTLQQLAIAMPDTWNSDITETANFQMSIIRQTSALNSAALAALKVEGEVALRRTHIGGPQELDDMIQNLGRLTTLQYAPRVLSPVDKKHLSTIRRSLVRSTEKGFDIMMATFAAEELMDAYDRGYNIRGLWDT